MLPSAFLASKPTKKISVLKFNPYLVSGMEDPLQRLTPATLLYYKTSTQLKHVVGMRLSLLLA